MLDRQLNHKGPSRCRISFSNIHSYKTGKNINVSNVNVINPPITTVANGLCTSESIDADKAIGKKPKLATQAVMSTGRRRRRALAKTASIVAAPPRAHG